jgi:site-specific recombinase XerD
MKIVVRYNRFKKTEGEASVHLDIQFSSYNRIFHHTGVKVSSEHWNPVPCRVRKTHPRHVALNLMIQNKIDELHKWESEMYRKQRPVNIDTCRAFLKGTDDGIELVKFVREMLTEETPHIGHETYRQRYSVINNLEKFNPGKLSKVDRSFSGSYHRHLLTTMKPESTGKNHKMMKRAFVRAIRMGLIEHNPYDGFKIPEARKRKTFLTTDELQKVRNYQGVERLEKIRDIFMFQCLTGISYADMQKLTPADLHGNQERHYITSRRQKTDEYYIIPLMPEALGIINQYRDDKRLFPAISNQKMNAYLHEIQHIVTLNKPLTTHVARHTFATLMLGKGMPLESVSHILGHSSTRITQDYAKMVLEKLEGDMTRLNITNL